MIKLTPQKLMQDAFKPFGNVIEMDEDSSFLINEGTTRRYHALANVDVDAQSGQAIISIFKSQRRSAPIAITMMEKHPLGSQAFLPAEAHDWLVVVATGDLPSAETCIAFIAKGNQGVQYAKNVWHHPLLPLVELQNFWIVDRFGEGDNLVEFYFENETAVIDTLL
ncbi:MAG: ureidoglycolate lyase [Rhizobiales bacterium]|nr:ureidoglycolate lyase [Hyphomicrobiales bacterium]